MERSVDSAELLFENHIATDTLLTAKELARRLGTHANQLYKLVRDGKIPAIKVGRALRFQWDEVIDTLRS